MQLLEIDALELQVRKLSSVDRITYSRGKNFADFDPRPCRPLAILSRNLCRDVNPLRRRSNNLSHQFLAVPVAISECGID